MGAAINGVYEGVCVRMSVWVGTKFINTNESAPLQLQQQFVVAQNPLVRSVKRVWV